MSNTSGNYQLSVLLKLNDKLSGGITKTLTKLRAFDKESKGLLKAVASLQRAMARELPSGKFKSASTDLKNFQKETKNTLKGYRELRESVRTGMPAQRERRNVSIREVGAGANIPGRGRRRGGRSGSGSGGYSAGDLTGDLARDVLTAGSGLALLRAFRAETRAAGDYETAVLGLRNAFQEVDQATGKVNEDVLKGQMQRGSALAVDLGNKLQGSTQDYVEILAALRQGGVQTEDILNGAGRSAAYLANVSGALKEGQQVQQAEELGMFFKMFKLQSKDFEKSVNLFSALKDRFNIDSSSLIESSKYFQATAGSLKITGISGAEETIKLFALLKREGGLEGSQAGTGSRAMLTQLFTEQKKLQKLKKETGIDIQAFDKKGNFLGYENLFKQMEQFRKLSSEKRGQWMNNIFGERGGEVASVMVDQGVEGWNRISEEANKAVPVQEKINQQMQTYAAKVEAVSGSWDNLKATMATPVIDWAKPQLDSVNNLLAKTQEFSKEHRSLSLVVTSFLGIGGAALTTAAAVNGLRTAWGLWRIASRVSRADSLADYFAGISKGAGGASGEVGGLLSKLKSMKTIGAIGVTVAVAYTVKQIIDHTEAEGGAREATKGAYDAKSLNLKSFERLEKRYADMGQPMPKQYYSSTADAAMKELFRKDKYKGFFGESETTDYMSEAFKGNRLWNMVESVSRGLTLQPQNPYTGWGGWHQGVAANTMRENFPELGKPQIMLEFQKMLSARTDITPENKSTVSDTLKQAFPKSFSEAAQLAAMEAANLAMKTGELNTSFNNLLTPTNSLLSPLSLLPPSLQNAGDAASNFAARINGITITQPTSGTITNVPDTANKGEKSPRRFVWPLKSSSASGSIVHRDGLVMAHRGNVITPASLSRRSAGDWIKDFSSPRPQQGRNFNVTFNIYGGDPQKIASEIEKRLSKLERATQSPKGLRDSHDPDALARMVVNSAKRHKERA